MARCPMSFSLEYYFTIIITMASSCHPSHRLRTGALRHFVEDGAQCPSPERGEWHNATEHF